MVVALASIGSMILYFGSADYVFALTPWESSTPEMSLYKEVMTVINEFELFIKEGLVGFSGSFNRSLADFINKVDVGSNLVTNFPLKN